jgi:ABC-type glycerol-3-phosphate transport system permease component
MELMELSPVQRAGRWLALALGLLFTLVPVFWVLSVAFRPAGSFTFPVGIVPSALTLDNFSIVLFGAKGIGLRPYLNAAIYGLSAALLTAIISSLAGYALARYDLRFGRALLLMFLALNFLPAAARVVPLFLLYVRTDLYDRQIGLVLAYVAGATPLGIWLMAGTIRQIPIRLEQAARIDGAGAFTVAWRILLPLAMPGVLVVATLAFVDGWNSFSLPLILTQRPEVQPYTVLLRQFVQPSEGGVDWTLLAAGSLLGVIPVLVAFALLQSRLVGAADVGGAVKG